MKRKILPVAGLFLLLALNYAALDDITTGKEPNYYLEYSFVSLSLIGLLIFLVWKGMRKSWSQG